MRRFKSILKIGVISILVLAACLVLFHFWLLAHAKNILSEIVLLQSKGKYKLEVKKIRYDYLKLRLELDEPVLASTDSVNSGDNFEMNTQFVSFQLEKLWPLISGRQLLIDSIYLDHPSLSLVHQKRSSSQIPKTAFSLSVEMEKLYQSIQSVLTTLKVANFRINKGAFTLNRSSQKNAVPFEIKDIDFYIKGFNIDSATISQHPNSYTEDVQLRIAGQTIHFPEGDKLIQFSSFRFVANKGSLEVDSCRISGGENDSTKASFALFAEKMRIKNVFLAGNDSTDYNRIDSLFFTRPKVSLSIQIKDSRQDSSETIATAIRKITSAAFGRLLVRYMSINNVDFDIDVERKEKLSTFNFVQDSLVVSNLGVGLFPSMPLSASSIRFGVKEFVDYFRDSTYLVRFDSVRINDDQFSLFNINIESTTRVKKGKQKILIPTLEMKSIDWFQLISEKKLVAAEFSLYDPSISIEAVGDSKNKRSAKHSNLEDMLRQTFALKNIHIINGSVNYRFPGTGSIIAKNINTSLTPDLSSSNFIMSLQKMIKNLNAGELVYMKDGWQVTANNIIYTKQNSLTARSINLINKVPNLQIKANDVDIFGITNDSKSNLLGVKKINWGNANIVMAVSSKQSSDNKSTISIGAINGGATDLRLTGDKSNIHAKISKIKSGDIILDKGKLKVLNDLTAEGNSIDIIADNTEFHTGKFTAKDKSSSTLTSVKLSVPVSNNLLKLDIPRVDFETDVQTALSGSFGLSWLKVLQPKIDLIHNPIAQVVNSKKQNQFPEINLRNIEITQSSISLQGFDARSMPQLDLGSSDISIAGIKTIANRDQLSFNDVQIQSKNFGLVRNDSLKISSSNGIFKMGSKSFVLYAPTSTSPNNWQLKDASIDLTNIMLLNKRFSGQADTLQLTSLHSENISVNDHTFSDPIAYFNERPLFKFNNVNLNYKNKKARISIKGLKGDGSNLALDSFVYRPQINRLAFMAGQTYQKDYITLETGKLSLNSIDFAAWIKDSILRAGHLTISNAVLNDTRDKHLPLQPDVIKGLPVTIIKNVPIKTLIDSVSINNGRVRYHEISEKTNQTGNIRFTRLQAVISNIKNYGFADRDSLTVVASAYLIDSAHVKMKIKESYNDSLGGFTLTASARPFDMKVLNPFVLPVMSARIKSGKADSLQIRAVGREYVSLGEMLLFYHDLKVEFLKANYDQKKTFLTSLITFAANSFVIRTKNTNRVGKILYERSRNRSFFNYLVRMVASGAASSVGAKRSPKYNRLYDEKIKELILPAYER